MDRTFIVDKMQWLRRVGRELRVYMNLIREGRTLADRIVILIHLLAAPARHVYKRAGKTVPRAFIADVTLANEDGLFFCERSFNACRIASARYEETLRDCFALDEGVFIDVGAHIGKYAIRAAGRLGERGEVAAVEPEPYNFSLLKTNVRLNRLTNVHLVNAACSDRDDDAFLYVDPAATTLHSLRKNRWIQGEKKIPVKIRKLDAIVSDLSLERVDLIKIDVEGFEMEVLRGARGVLETHRPHIVFEAWSEESLREIERWLRTFDYRVRQIQGQNCLAAPRRREEPEGAVNGPPDAARNGRGQGGALSGSRGSVEKAGESGAAIEKRSGFYQRIACPGCEFPQFSTLCDVAYSDPAIHDYLEAFYSAQGGVEFDCLREARWILKECDRCGLVYQAEAPDDLLAARLYERWIDPDIVFRTVEQKRDVLYYERLVKEIANVIRFFNAPPARLRLLDFGMGWGHWCRVASGFGCEVHGVEISDARIAFARESGVRVISNGEIERGAYDFINTEHVFEHLGAPLEVLKELKGALKPGGVIKIAVPNGADIKRRLRIWDWTLPDRHRNSLNPAAPLEHLNCFNHAALCAMAARAGLTPVRVPDRRPLFLLRSGVKSLLLPFYHLLVAGRLRKNTSLFFTPV